MILSKILAIDKESDESLFIKLQPISTSEKSVYTVTIPNKNTKWIEGSFSKNKPVSLDLQNKDIFPSLIALEVKRLYGSYLSEDGIPYFAFPKPAPVYLNESNKNFEKLLSILTEIEGENKSAIIAVKEGYFIEDILKITPEEAENFLGITAN